MARKFDHNVRCKQLGNTEWQVDIEHNPVHSNLSTQDEQHFQNVKKKKMEKKRSEIR